MYVCICTHEEDLSAFKTLSLCICKNHIFESDRYALSYVSLRTVTSLGEQAFAGLYPDLLLVW